MFGMVVRNRYTGDASRQDAFTGRVDSDLFPHLRQTPGFRAYYAIRDDDRVVTHVVILWGSRDQAEAFLASEASHAWSRTVREYGAQIDDIHRGEVVRHLDTGA